MQRHHDQGPFDLAGHNHELTHNAVWLHFGGCSAGKVARFGNQLQQTGQISVIATKSINFFSQRYLNEAPAATEYAMGKWVSDSFLRLIDANQVI